MKKFGKKSVVTALICLVGSMTFLAGCKASEELTTEIVVLPDETIVEITVAAETQPMKETEQETKRKDKTQEEPETQPMKETESETGFLTKEQAEQKPEANQEPEQTYAAIQETEGSVADSDYAAIVKGITIPLHADMRNYAASLGDPDAFSSAKSCTEAGEDKVYTYGGTVIYTYVTNGADVISLIEMTGSETLASGIQIGSTKEEVIAAYGSTYTEDGAEWLYETGGKTIGLQMSDNKVSFIELF